MLASSHDKVRAQAAMPSLEMSLCDGETRQFGEETARLSGGVSILVISTDMPYMQKR